MPKTSPAPREAEDQAAGVTKEIKERIKARMTADQLTKLKVPDVIRFCLSTSNGRKGWDAKAIEGEINGLRKGELPAVEGLEPEQLEAAAPVIARLLPALAARIANCQKIGAPSTTFRTYAA